jgi:glycosidase
LEDKRVEATGVEEAEDTAVTPWVIGDRNGRLGVELDTRTGLAIALVAQLDPARRVRLPLRVGATLVTEGTEVEAQPFGLAYAGTVDLAGFVLVSREARHTFAGYDEVFVVETRTGDWQVLWEYRFRGSTPRLEIRVELAPLGAGTATLRNFHVTLDFAPDALDQWRVHAPGSPIRSGVPATALVEPVATSEATFSGSGIVVLDQADAEIALLLWPFSRTELSVNRLQAIDGALRLSVGTGLAGRIAPGEQLAWGGFELDLLPGTWDAIRPRVPTWFRTLGIATPADTAGWIPDVSIYEVQIGESVFWNGYAYSPYPTMRDLLDDLGRIAGLGFDCIQVMPRQPFPSYNVYDYADITLSYGDEVDLKAVVAAAHALGLKVILDILMHGVIDAEIIGRAADRVRGGPYFARLDEGTELVPDDAFTAYNGQDYLVAWSRHIIDFEPHWAGGSPGSHPLVDEHPEWFVRRTDGEIIGVYTKAFDVSNIAWQEYFTDAALNLVRTLDIDGFRFDAPTYNEFPNWSPATEKRASAQQLGAVEHFARLRPEMKALKPEAMLYTEPSGTLFRQTMDITYNYDEHWLIHAVLRPDRALETNPLGIRHARDLAAWFRDKQATLPQGAITARHIDSHDTFWWPLPGFKWKREQYGIPATKALLATWALAGGVYMSFVGGETGIEPEVRRVNRLRHEVPEIRLGTADFDVVAASDDRIFAVARVLEDGISLVLVNLSNAAFTSEVALAPDLVPPGAVTVRDQWGDRSLAHDGDYTWDAADLASFDLDFAPYQVYVLTIRPAAI